ncbi:MAG: hypothetical protein AABW85_06225 [archaeon]
MTKGRFKKIATNAVAAARKAEKLFRGRNPMPPPITESGLAQKFPALHRFIIREANFFPALLEYNRVSAKKLETHPNGTPIITGDPHKDQQLLSHCREMAKIEIKITHTLIQAGAEKNLSTAAQLVEIARLQEEMLCGQKMHAREILLHGLEKLERAKKPQIRQYKKFKETKGTETLRLFLTEEAKFFPQFYKLRGKLASIDSLEKEGRNTIAHEGTHIPRITGDLKTDQKLAKQCTNIFTFRNYIRDKVANARKAKSDSPETHKALRQAAMLEKQIDHFKANVRSALLNYKPR